MMAFSAKTNQTFFHNSKSLILSHPLEHLIVKVLENKVQNIHHRHDGNKLPGYHYTPLTSSVFFMLLSCPDLIEARNIY